MQTKSALGCIERMKWCHWMMFKAYYANSSVVFLVNSVTIETLK